MECVFATSEGTVVLVISVIVIAGYSDLHKDEQSPTKILVNHIETLSFLGGWLCPDAPCIEYFILFTYIYLQNHPWSIWDSAWLINPLGRLFEYKRIWTVVILTSGDRWDPSSYSSIISWFISCFIPPNLLRYMMFHDISLSLYIYTHYI